MAPMSAAATSRPGESVGGPTRRRLAAFCRVLRQNGFKVGLAETRDALALLALPLAARPSPLQPASRALLQTRPVTGAPTDGRAPLRRLADATGPQGPAGLPDHVERRSEGDGPG